MRIKGTAVAVVVTLTVLGGFLAAGAAYADYGHIACSEGGSNCQGLGCWGDDAQWEGCELTCMLFGEPYEDGNCNRIWEP